jgi:hypothetical protein
MFLRGLKYIGGKEVGQMVVLKLNPTHPQRTQVFKKEEVKLLGRDIDPEIANYLASEYRGAVEFVEIEVDTKILFAESMKQAKEKFDSELPTEDALQVFCEVFGVSLIDQLQARTAELETALRELTELKEKPAKKMKRSKAAKAK